MALLNEEDENEQANQPGAQQAQQLAQPAGQPVNPIVPQSGLAKPPTPPAQGGIPGAAQIQRQPQKKGTGFTNLSRIMQANQGNRLGQTVAGGVTGQVQNLQSGIQQSQQAFGTEAQKGRLDTPEAAAQRAAVLGRFDTANFVPDESKFQVSSGLQSQYEGQKTALTQQQQQAQQAASTQRAAVQSKIDADTRALAALRAAPKKSPMMGGIDQMNKIRGYEASLASLRGVLGAATGASAAQEKEIADKLANIESQYGTMSAAEKTKFIADEKEKMVTAQLPTDEEAEAFRKYQTGTYTGPTELQDFQSLLGKAQQTEDLGTLARSSGGRQELLKQFVGGRDYTQGQRGLDEAILGQDKSSLLSRAAKKALGAEKGVSQANLVAANQAQDFVNKAKAFGEETRGQITAAGAPISAEIDADVAAAQQKETERQAKLKSYQDILAGTDPKYAGMDQMSRVGSALQDAASSGFLSQSDLASLLGDESRYGLVERGMQQGVDISKLLSGALTGTGAQNITRAGVASGADVARLNALDKLMGKTSTDQEFGSAGAKYQSGGIGFDQSALLKSVMEAEGYKEPTYQTPEQGKLTSTQQMALGSAPAMKAMSGTGEFFDAWTGLYTDPLTGKNTVGKAAEGSVQTAGGAVRMVDEGENAVLKKLLGLTAGKYQDKYGGKQINDLINYQSQLKDQALGSLTKEGTNVMSGIGDLNSTGRMDQALAKLSGFDAAKNITGNIERETKKAISTALSGGKTGNWAASDLNAIDATTGKKTKIREYANKSSQDILNQMVSQSQIGRTAGTFKGRTEGAMQMNELLKYYNAALKREGKKK